MLKGWGWGWCCEILGLVPVLISWRHAEGPDGAPSASSNSTLQVQGSIHHVWKYYHAIAYGNRQKTRRRETPCWGEIRRKGAIPADTGLQHPVTYYSRTARQTGHLGT